nr:hypothetical protein [Propionicimonas sp.]
MDVDALRVRYRQLAVTACEWRAMGLADPEDMAEEVFARLDPRKDHGLRDLYSAIDAVVIASYQRYSDSISIMDRLRGGGALIGGPRKRNPSDDFLEALSRLRQADRDLIQLRFWDELDEAEAAEVTRVTPEVARERLARAGTRYLAKLSRTHPDLAISDIEDTIRSIKPGVNRRFD